MRPELIRRRNTRKNNEAKISKKNQKTIIIKRIRIELDIKIK